jgi:hypothetical protein
MSKGTKSNCKNKKLQLFSVVVKAQISLHGNNKTHVLLFSEWHVIETQHVKSPVLKCLKIVLNISGICVANTCCHEIHQLDLITKHHSIHI